MGITIEEIIVKETEIAQEFQKVVDTHMVSEDFSLEEMYCDDTEIIEEKLKKYQELADVHNQIADTMRKYQQLQADYENRLKADMVAMLTELQLEIEECEDCGRAFHLGLQMASKIIQKKIDKLKEGT